MKRIALLLLIAGLLGVSVGISFAGPTSPTDPAAILHVQEWTPAGAQADAWRLSHLDGVIPLPGNHDEALAYLLATGVVRGDANGDLGSGAPITREQAASMLVRLIDTNSSAPLPPGHHRFPDVSGTHADAVNRLAASGIVAGGVDGTFSPRRTVTRAQAATLLVRTLELLDDAAV